MWTRISKCRHVYLICDPFHMYVYGLWLTHTYPLRSYWSVDIRKVSLAKQVFQLNFLFFFQLLSGLFSVYQVVSILEWNIIGSFCPSREHDLGITISFFNFNGSVDMIQYVLVCQMLLPKIFSEFVFADLLLKRLN